ncbi:replication protein A 70 kDa DNA-binding subunit B isoform X2 [Cannabis sativa]|uniref:replication protein A 70 kDa DNA-binding subunit B isoform X2 n=1 Tax=Cannabis sativa TaxID=3483 RepID=UPI0029CA8980|nr:replication protein A 70 kDa DNA-binding subunit B isoform X2 [Cannabis sativa]
MLTLVEYNFTPFVSFSDHMDQSTSVDLMAVAIIVNPKKQIYTSNCLQDLQELIVVNEEKKPIGLTCWGHFVVNECATITKLIATTPIIVARRLKVTSFNEISLSTKIDSSLMINPNVAKVQTLRRWCTENETFLQDPRMNKKTCLESMSHLIKPQLHLMTPINAIKPVELIYLLNFNYLCICLPLQNSKQN